MQFMFESVPSPRLSRYVAIATVVDDDVEITPAGAYAVAGQRVRFRVRVGEPFGSSTTVALSSTAPDIVSVPETITFSAGSTLAQVDALALRAGMATISVQLPAGRGRGQAQAIVSVQAAPPRRRTIR